MLGTRVNYCDAAPPCSLAKVVRRRVRAADELTHGPAWPGLIATANAPATGTRPELPVGHQLVCISIVPKYDGYDWGIDSASVDHKK